jgi:hypothetical protein
MSKVVGTVSAILSSTAKNGTKYWRFQVSEEKRSFGVGTIAPKFATGDLVSFTVQKNDNGFWDAVGEVEKVQGNPTAAGYAANPRGTAPSGARATTLSKDDYWANREQRDVDTQKRIELQSCRNSAIEVVKVMLTPVEGELPIGKLPAKNKRYDFILALVDEITHRFIDANAGKKSNPAEAPTDEQAEIAAQGDVWQ